MNVSFYQAAAAMNANARWQELISENLAASSVPGFKKQELSFEAIQAGLRPQSDMLRPGVPLPVSLPSTNSFTNFSGGDLRPTGVKTDIALEGPGFFEVQLPNGTNAFTRDGEFHLSPQGQLTTKRGYPVLGDGGPIQIDPSAGPVSISPTGDVSQDGELKGKLKIADFKNPNLLTPVGGGVFEARDANLQPATDTKATVRQGWLETANTSASKEMANLILATRSFEANQRIVQMQDERTGRLITELGNPS